MSKKISRWMGPAAIGIISAGLFSSAFLKNAKADDDFNERTVVTINKPVEVPGRVLSAGTYVFRLFNSDSERQVVQVFSKDERHLVTTFIGVPIYRETPPSNTILNFQEVRTGAPEELREWFYPGQNYGLKFNYPQSSNAD